MYEENKTRPTASSTETNKYFETTDRDLRRVCIRVYEEDYEKLRDVSRTSGVGLNKIIRQVLHSYANQLRNRERKNLDKLVRPSASTEPESPTEDTPGSPPARPNHTQDNTNV